MLTKAQALDLFQSDDLIGIGMEVEAVCGRERSRGPQRARFFARWGGEREPAAEILSEAKDLCL
jgi:hypothetical protein